MLRHITPNKCKDDRGISVATPKSLARKEKGTHTWSNLVLSWLWNKPNHDEHVCTENTEATMETQQKLEPAEFLV